MTHLPFQSLTWVERLSDRVSVNQADRTIEFQSLTWVERLSDRHCIECGANTRSGFNPSPGLNVFQT